ncbi:MAG: DUF3450 family protein [Verrucomicrobiota bacterium]
MKFRHALQWTLTGTLAALSAHAADSVDTTRDTLARWAEARQLISREKTDWRVEQSILAETKTLLAEQVTRLEQSLKEIAETASSADEERAGLAKERDELGAATDAIKAPLADMETRVRAIIKTLPAPLLNKLQPLIRRLPDDPATTKLSVGERVQNIVGILNEADKFNNTITFTSEIREVSPGKEVEVRTLYWGVAIAYYVDASGQYAGIGRPAADGWEWPQLPESSAAIQKLFAIYDGVADIEFVEAPVRIN